MDATDPWPLLTIACRRFLASTYQTTGLHALNIEMGKYQELVQQCMRQVACLDWMLTDGTPSRVDMDAEVRGIVAHIIAATELNTSLSSLQQTVQMLEGRVNVDPTNHLLARVAVPFLAEQFLQTSIDVLLCRQADDPDAALAGLWTSLDVMAALNTDRMVAMRSVGVHGNILAQGLSQKHWARFDGLPRAAAAALNVLLPWTYDNHDLSNSVCVQEWEARLPRDQVPDARLRMFTGWPEYVMVSDSTPDAAVSAILKLMYQVPDLVRRSGVLKGGMGTIDLALTTPASVARAGQVLTTIAATAPKEVAADIAFQQAVRIVWGRLWPGEWEEEPLTTKMVARAQALASVNCVFSVGIANALISYKSPPVGNRVDLRAIVAMLPCQTVRAEFLAMLKHAWRFRIIAESWSHLRERLAQMVKDVPVGALELPGWLDVLRQWVDRVRQRLHPDAFLTPQQMLDRYQLRLPGPCPIVLHRSEWQCPICLDVGDEAVDPSVGEPFPFTSFRVDGATFWGGEDPVSPIVTAAGACDGPVSPIVTAASPPTDAPHPWYQTPGKIITLECGHTYHLACVLRMEGNGHERLECALCRSVTVMGTLPPEGTSNGGMTVRMAMDLDSPFRRRSPLTGIPDRMPMLPPPPLEVPLRTGTTPDEAHTMLLNRIAEHHFFQGSMAP